MIKDKAITYSLLAHIRNTGTLAKGPIDIFIPLIKRVLSEMNYRGIYEGKSLIEIQLVAKELYSIDFPIPVLKKILQEIANDLNTEDETAFYLYGDGAFSIKQYVFSDYEDVIQKKKSSIDEIENLFKNFCETSEIEGKKPESIFHFIEKNKYNLSKYISNSDEVINEDQTIEAQFVEYFKNIPSIYEVIKSIYLGSIIAGYIEYNSDDKKRDIELLLDTNFIVGLIDLNTPESTHTCRTLIEIAKQQNFKVRVLKITIEETQNLLHTKARYFDKSFLQKKVNPEDVYNACDRRNLNKIDLERIADNLESTIGKFGISTIYQKKLEGEAKISEDYNRLKNVRNSKQAALHDAIALLHIRKTRKKKVRDFDKANAWFVNNSISSENDSHFLRKGYLPETIKADDLLNILWLSNPSVNKSIEGDDLAEIGLTSIISLTLNNNLPKSRILRELDDNIHKYAKEEISDADIIRVATRITSKQLKDIETLNDLAEKDKESFVKRLEEEALKQKRIEETRQQKLEDLFKHFTTKLDKLEKKQKSYTEKEKNIDFLQEQKSNSENQVSRLEQELLDQKNQNRAIQRNIWISKKVSKWRLKSWIELFLCLFGFAIFVFFLFRSANWSFTQLNSDISDLSNNIIFSAFFTFFWTIVTIIYIRGLYDKYRNQGNIASFKKNLEVPKEYEELKAQ